MLHGIVLTKNAKQLTKAVDSPTRKGFFFLIYTTNNPCLGGQDQGNLPLYLLEARNLNTIIAVVDLLPYHYLQFCFELNITHLAIKIMCEFRHSLTNTICTQ